MADAFIEERRASLERYLQRLALHEAALKSEVCSRARCALMRTPLLTLSQVCACECVCVCVNTCLRARCALMCVPLLTLSQVCVCVNTRAF